MSMFSYPTELSADAMKKQMDAMSGWMKTADLDVPPVFAHPAGAFAAATALGLGVAGHMTGLMLGAMQGAMKMQAEAFALPGELFGVPPTGDFVEAPVVRKKADSTAEVVPMKRAAAEVVETVEPVVSVPKKTAKPVTRAARATKATAEAPTARVAPAVNAGAMDKLKSDADMAAAASVETAVAGAPVEIKAPATATAADAKPVLEPEDFRRPAEMQKPETPDDLKAISGIGPKLEQVLNSLGIWTYEQVAAWNEAEIAWLDDYLQFKGRIDRDGWVGQAADFAKGSKA